MREIAGETVATLEGIQIIDCDAHFTESADLWTSRAPASLQGKMPVQKTINGYTDWYLNDELGMTTGGNTIQTGRRRVRGQHIIQPFDRVDEAAWS